MWRRGADSDGIVANFVESEQIMQFSRHTASFVQGVFSDLYVVKGTGIGHEIVSVHLLEPQFEHMADKIVLTVAEAMSLDPPLPVFVLIGATVHYCLKVIRGNIPQAARALKSVLQGILLSSEGEKLNSVNLVLYMAPIAVLFLVPATFLMEENMVGITIALAGDDIKIIFYLLFNSALAYCVNFTNFLVTKHTSPLTLQVLGNAKGAVAVVISILIFKNPISATGMMGYLLTIIGVVLYSTAKKRSK